MDEQPAETMSVEQQISNTVEQQHTAAPDPQPVRTQIIGSGKKFKYTGNADAIHVIAAGRRIEFTHENEHVTELTAEEYGDLAGRQEFVGNLQEITEA